MQILETPEASELVGSLPKHIACIMDGNGRWALARGKSRTEGHVAGEHALSEVTRAASDLGIEWLTVYAFSTENWRRPPEEVAFLTDITEALRRRRSELLEQGARIRWIGTPVSDLGTLPVPVVDEIERAVEDSRHNTGLNFTIAYNYGGRTEILDGVRRALREGLDPDALDEQTFARMLYVEDLPNVDLLVRTSGEMRISNFLLWGIAYAEIVTTDTLWPDFTSLHLISAIGEYQRRKRRLGASRAE